MRVLMLGWEFPPHISGGLGTACYGITQGLMEKGTDIAFILPIVYVCYAVNGDLTRSTVEQRKAIVDAAWECCEMLKAAVSL